MKKLLILSLAVAAFAVPATASASPFTHEGAEVPAGGVDAEFTGPAGWVIAEVPSVGVHCPELHIKLKVTTAHAHVTEYDTTTTCTGTHPNPALNNLNVHAHPIDIGSWTVDADAANNRLTITNVHITTTTTNAAGGTVISQSTLIGGSVHGVVNNNNAIGTASLSDTGATLQSLPGGAVLEGNITGHLTSNGTIGIH